MSMIKKFINRFDTWLTNKVSRKKRQWIWFIILWVLGFSCVTALGYAIRSLMGLNA